MFIQHVVYTRAHTQAHTNTPEHRQTLIYSTYFPIYLGVIDIVFCWYAFILTNSEFDIFTFCKSEIHPTTPYNDERRLLVCFLACCVIILLGGRVLVLLATSISVLSSYCSHSNRPQSSFANSIQICINNSNRHIYYVATKIKYLDN